MTREERILRGLMGEMKWWNDTLGSNEEQEFAIKVMEAYAEAEKCLADPNRELPVSWQEIEDK